MVKVITYGTYDLLHYGHIRLLERAKALGDYLIVGVTSDDYDKSRGKINNRQSLMERIASVEATGIADEVIVEEYEGQKIDDIKKYKIDIFTVGSDWEGQFDYLKEYCRVVYLSRTDGISSTQIRSIKTKLRIGILGDEQNELTSVDKFLHEISFVNGVEAECIHVSNGEDNSIDDFRKLVSGVDALYICSHPTKHYENCKMALRCGKHVLCESPIALDSEQCRELFQLAEDHSLIMMDGIKTAYTTAFQRLVLLSKTGKIGSIISVDAICTSRKNIEKYSAKDFLSNWNTITEWGPPALLPIFKILGTDFLESRIITKIYDEQSKFDSFTKIDFIYKDAVASIRIAKGAKAEGDLIVSGTDGYIYVPAPWWKTDYFEIRKESPVENRRYYYQLDGEGIRYEIVAFARAIEKINSRFEIEPEETAAICKIIGNFYKNEGVKQLSK